MRGFFRRLWERLLGRGGVARVTYTTGDPDEWPLPSDSEPLPPGAYMHPGTLREHAQRVHDREVLEQRARDGRIDD